MNGRKRVPRLVTCGGGSCLRVSDPLTTVRDQSTQAAATVHRIFEPPKQASLGQGHQRSQQPAHRASDLTGLHPLVDRPEKSWFEPTCVTAITFHLGNVSSLFSSSSQRPALALSCVPQKVRRLPSAGRVSQRRRRRHLLLPNETAEAPAAVAYGGSLLLCSPHSLQVRERRIELCA